MPSEAIPAREAAEQVPAAGASAGFGLDTAAVLPAVGDDLQRPGAMRRPLTDR